MHHRTITGCHLMLLEFFWRAACSCWDQKSVGNDFSGYLEATTSTFSSIMATRSSWESLSTIIPSFVSFFTICFSFLTFLLCSFNSILCCLIYFFRLGVGRYRSLVWLWGRVAALGETNLLLERRLLSELLCREQALQHCCCSDPAARSISQPTCRMVGAGINSRST